MRTAVPKASLRNSTAITERHSADTVGFQRRLQSTDRWPTVYCPFVRQICSLSCWVRQKINTISNIPQAASALLSDAAHTRTAQILKRDAFSFIFLFLVRSISFFISIFRLSNSKYLIPPIYSKHILAYCIKPANSIVHSSLSPTNYHSYTTGIWCRQTDFFYFILPHMLFPSIASKYIIRISGIQNNKIVQTVGFK
jgi:hypothetical protein